MIAVISVIVFVIVMLYLFKGVSSPPTIDSREVLEEQGYSNKEINKELRAQRAEQRSFKYQRSNALRTASRVSKTTTKLLKKL